MVTIYHNGECSKSKGALEILQEQGVPHTVRWYLMEPLSEAELRALLLKLHLPASALVRKSEPLYKEQFEGKTLTEEQWLHILIENPELIERPIVEIAETALVARPPERIFDLIGPPKP